MLDQSKNRVNEFYQISPFQYRHINQYLVVIILTHYNSVLCSTKYCKKEENAENQHFRLFTQCF